LKKKNIIFFLPNYDIGGAAQSITNAVINLNPKKYNLFVFCLGKCAYKNKLINHKIKVCEINKSKTIFSFNKIKNKILSINKQTGLKSIFVSNINYANVLSLIFLTNIPNLKIVTVDRTPIQELDYNYNDLFLFCKNLLIKYLIKIFYKKASARVGNSKTLSSDLSKVTRCKIHTIYPYSLKSIKPQKSKKIKKKKITTILWIGRLSREKSLITLIKAINIINKEKLYIKIFGNGPEKKKYLNVIKNFNLTKKIKFFGYKSNIDKYLSNADLYVSTSLYEGFQNSMIEAINNNIPVISSSSYGGITDILKKNKFGHTYSVGDYKNLSILIKKFINNPKPFYKKSNLAKKNLKNFNFHVSTLKYEKIFDNI
tara:strand:+ start:901 stop:2010 length:1110 start_codon:yes stop_codon:yes gene_type:complete